MHRQYNNSLYATYICPIRECKYFDLELLHFNYNSVFSPPVGFVPQIVSKNTTSGMVNGKRKWLYNNGILVRLRHSMCDNRARLCLVVSSALISSAMLEGMLCGKR